MSEKLRPKSGKIHDLLAGGILTAISGFVIYAAAKDYDKLGFIPSGGGVMITICGYACTEGSPTAAGIETPEVINPALHSSNPMLSSLLKLLWMKVSE